MKAIVCTKYGSPDVLQLQDVKKPSPKDDEVLIKIQAASINSRDWRMMRANPFFIRLVPGASFNPKIRYLGLMSPGGLRRLAGTSSNSSQVMKFSGTCPVQPVAALLPNMSAPMKMQSR